MIELRRRVHRSQCRILIVERVVVVVVVVVVVSDNAHLVIGGGSPIEPLRSDNSARISFLVIRSDGTP